MATKFLHSLTDDNPDLQKQIGCMTGIFQLFDRQHIITPRRITGHSTKRIASGGIFEKESSTIYNRSATAEKHSSKHVLERQRLSTESSRASFSSSSRSSSFSSLDYNKTGQTEPLSFDRIIFPETPSRDPAMSQANTSPQFGCQMLDLREVVKDSMYREAQGLPVKTAGRDEAAHSLAKHRESPRPVQLSRANDGSYGHGVNGKQDLPVDLKESLRVLSKLREAPWYANEPRELSRSSSYQSKDGSHFSLAKEAPRFSYDGKEMRNVPFESRENSKSFLKSKELPRLSLDSRENSMRSFNSDFPPDLYMKFPQKDNGSSNSNITSQQQKSGTQARPPSVVAKLMGLEALPDSISSSESKRSTSNISVEETIHFARSSEPSDQSRPIQVSNSAKNLWKEPRSPRWKNPDLVMKPISRFPIEPAPWKQMDGNRSSQKPAFKSMKAPAKSPNNFPSVYSEIEKRIKDLEFSQSGKDLRALKQILEAMQAKGLLETQKEEALNFSTSNDREQRFTNSTSARVGSQRKLQNDVSTSTRRGTMSSRNFESPIVIMKPAKLLEKSGIPASSVIPIDDLSSLPKIQGGTFSDSRKSAINSKAAKDQIPKSGNRDDAGNSKVMKSNNRVVKSPQTSIKSPQLPKESSTGSLKSSGSISPRMQQKRQELEKRSRPPIPPSDFSTTRRQPNNKQATESSSPGGRRRSKSLNLQLSDDQLSGISNESRNLSYHENEISARSDGSIISDSRMDVEVTSAERSSEISNGHSPPMGAARYVVSDLINKKSMAIATEEEPLAEHPTVAPEYPSPVSVLDSVVDMDDSPSPVKRMTKTFRGDESLETNVISNTEDCSVVDSLATNAVGTCPASEISRKKLQNVENLVQKLRRLNSSHDEARIDYIASLCDNTNPDHRYISEILLASGLLLRDLGSSLTNFQFHPSGHPINPELFLVLEQTKGSSTYLKEECAPEQAVQLRSKQKIHRKLIFDTINESLARKLAIVEPSSDPWLRSLKLARKSLNAQKLLRELCLEVELLQGKTAKSSSEDEDDGLKTILWEDVMNRSENWTAFNCEVSSMVLDVERMIFKDLVDEVVIGEAPALRNKPVRRRQLFAK